MLGAFAAAGTVAMLGLSQPGSAAPPPPPSGVQINCDATAYASEQLICSDPLLLARDAEMMAAYWRMIAATAEARRQSAADDQIAWMRRRNMCAFQADGRACVLKQYDEREAMLAGSPRRP